MLGAHTKLVNSYGKRKNRIVTHDSTGATGKVTTSINIFDEVEVVEIGPIVSRMKKKGENCTPTRPKAGSPRRVHVSKAFGMTKKKHLSPAKNRVAKIFEDFAVKKKKVIDVREESWEEVEVEEVLLGQATPPRAPLVSLGLNVPASPIADGKRVERAANKPSKPLARKSTTPLTDTDSIQLTSAAATLLTPAPIPTTGAPATPNKQAGVQPKVKLANKMKRRQTTSSSKDVQTVDIIVIDADGTPVKQERRVSKKTVVIPTPPSPEIISVEPPPAQSKSKRTTKRAVIISDSGDSDVEELPTVYVKKSPPQPKTTPPVKTNGIVRSGSSGPKGLVLEVLVPPAPYPTSSSSKSLLQSQEKHRPTAEPTNFSSPPAPEPEVFQPITETEPEPEPAAAPPIPNPRFAYLSSPAAKPRQLTPIRRGASGQRNSLFPHHRIASPRAPFGRASSSRLQVEDDFSLDDLNLELEELSLGLDESGEFGQLSFTGVDDVPEYLKPLLEECHQSTCGPVEFSSFIETFPFDPVVGRSQASGEGVLKFRKIGEASYSEVFGIGDVVLKVIPLRDESRQSTGGVEDIPDGPAESDAGDVLREIIVTGAMGDVCGGGFVELLKTYVVRGKYPEVLLRLWDEYEEMRGSESVRPDTFLVSQVYAIVVLSNGGPDLEAFNFVNASTSGWRQACSLFWQVAKTLAIAETLVSFEHRDLHWGQILVRSSSPAIRDRTNLPSGTRIPMDDSVHGVHATLIDLGLARMDAGDGAGGEVVHWTKFDDEIFMGQGDYQFDIYRMMRHHIGEDWQAFKPLTNVMWLHYLAQKLMFSKGLKPPRTSTTTSKATFSERECYESLLEVERWLGDRVAQECPADMKTKGVKKPRGRPRKTTTVVPAAIPILEEATCAGEVVAYAVRKGWVEGVAV